MGVVRWRQCEQAFSVLAGSEGKLTIVAQKLSVLSGRDASLDVGVAGA